jgi:hypothetical protein
VIGIPLSPPVRGSSAAAATVLGEVVAGPPCGATVSDVVAGAAVTDVVGASVDEVEPSGPTPPPVVVVTAVDEVGGVVVEVVVLAVVLVVASVDEVEPSGPSVELVSGPVVEVGGTVVEVVVVVDVLVVLVDVVVGAAVVEVGAAVVDVGAAVVEVGGIVVDVVAQVVVGAAVVVVGRLCIWQFASRSTDVDSVSEKPSGHVPSTVSVIVPLVTPGTVVVACVVPFCGTGDVYPTTGNDCRPIVAVAVAMSIGSVVSLFPMLQFTTWLPLVHTVDPLSTG